MSEKMGPRNRSAGRAETRTKVLGLQRRLEGDDDYELYRLDVVRECFRYPVISLNVRVGVTGPIVWEEPSEEAKEEAAKLLLGLKKVPWWKRWWNSEVEKSKGVQRRVSG